MQRPKSIMVFGILNVIFGALGVLGSLCNVVVLNFPKSPGFQNPVLEQLEQTPVLKAWTLLSLGLGAVSSAVMLAGGIGLLRTKKWGRLLSVGLSIYSLIFQFIGLFVSVVYVWSPMISRLDAAEGPIVFGIWAGLVGGMFGACLAFVYYSLMLYYMTRPVVIAAFEPDFDAGRFAPATMQAAQPLVSPGSPAAPLSPYAPPAAELGTGGSAAASGDDTMATIVPYKNAPALIGYYLGVFSLSACIPFIGILGVGMAIAAVICGINGLRRAREHPEAHGRVHAWIGIIGGGLCIFFGLAINITVIVALIASGGR